MNSFASLEGQVQKNSNEQDFPSNQLGAGRRNSISFSDISFGFLRHFTTVISSAFKGLKDRFVHFIVMAEEPSLKGVTDDVWMLGVLYTLNASKSNAATKKEIDRSKDNSHSEEFAEEQAAVNSQQAFCLDLRSRLTR